MQNPPKISKNQQGSILIAVIISISVVASLGAAMSTFLSSSTVTQTGSYDSVRAHSLGEAGGRFAIQQIMEFEYGSGSPYADRNALLAALNNQTFTLANGTSFHLVLTYASNKYTLESTGIPRSSVSRKVTYVINVYVPPGGAGGVDIPFDTDPGDNKVLNADNWNTVGDYEVDGGKVKFKGGGADTTISLDWHNASSSHPDLGDIWYNSDKLLTYEVQVKTKTKTDNLISGICFRLDTGVNKTIISDDEFYGLSLLDVGDGTALPAFEDRDGNPVSFSTDTQYIILWKQVGGTKTLLEKFTAPGAILSGGDFENWTGIFIRVQEQYDSGGFRENILRAYYSDANDYSKGTINWDYSDFTQIAWPGCDSSVDCSPTPGDCTCIVDNSLTSANFDINQPDEIGLHVFGGDSTDKAETVDVAIRFNFNAGKPTEY